MSNSDVGYRNAFNRLRKKAKSGCFPVLARNKIDGFLYKSIPVAKPSESKKIFIVCGN